MADTKNIKNTCEAQDLAASPSNPAATAPAIAPATAEQGQEQAQALTDQPLHVDEEVRVATMRTKYATLAC